MQQFCRQARGVSWALLQSIVSVHIRHGLPLHTFADHGAQKYRAPQQMNLLTVHAKIFIDCIRILSKSLSLIRLALVAVHSCVS